MTLLAQASTIAEQVDSVFLFMFAVSVAFLIFITFLLIFFAVRYSRKRNPKPKDIEGNLWLEVTWTAVPLALVLVMFYYGWTSFAYTRNAPRDAMAVKVLGRQWSWQFEYPNGKKTSELYLALDKPVRFEIESADVIHGFYIPAFRIKMDAVPGRVSHTWVKPTLLGSFDIECSVICGTSHSYMLSKAIVVPEKEFAAWLLGGENAPPPAAGVRTAEAPPGGAGTLPAGHPAVPEGPGPGEPPALALLREKGCLACHSTDGKTMVGPTFQGAYGAKEVVLEGGKEREVVVDEAFLKRSIREPLAEVLKGYPPSMPQVPLSDAEIDEVVGYIKGLN